MSFMNRIHCIANGHQFSVPQQQECWWVIECQCCGASRTADSVLEFLVSPVALCDAGDRRANRTHFGAEIGPTWLVI